MKLSAIAEKCLRSRGQRAWSWECLSARGSISTMVGEWSCGNSHIGYSGLIWLVLHHSLYMWSFECVEVHICTLIVDPILHSAQGSHRECIRWVLGGLWSMWCIRCLWKWVWVVFYITGDVYAGNLIDTYKKCPSRLQPLDIPWRTWQSSSNWHWENRQLDLNNDQIIRVLCQVLNNSLSQEIENLTTAKDDLDNLKGKTY